MSTTKVTLLAGLYGNTLEWYDFILYANFAPVIATLFFPTHDPSTSLLLTFAVFATGFLVRPFGAVIFGYIGDHFGRRAALITSMTIITLPTTLIGFVPTYDSIGIAAPVLLTLLRLMQGIAISGELNTAATYLIEHAKPNRRGLAGSLIMTTAFLGILMGAVASFVITNTIPHGTLFTWGWRLPFWFSGFLGFIGLYIRLHTTESPKYLQETHRAEKHTPLKDVLLNYRKQVCLTVLLTMIMAVGNYTFIAYIVTFLVKTIGLTLKEANSINLISMLIMLCLAPMAGLLSDKIGRKPVFKAGIFGFVFLSLPIFWLLSQKSFACALAGDILLGLLLVPIAGIIPSLIAELFPTRVRNSGTAIGYNIALALFGGTAPLIGLKLVQITESNYAPALYLMICAIISGLTLFFVKDRYKEPL